MSIIDITTVKDRYQTTSTQHALEAAVSDGWTICHYNTPIEDAREGISVDDALEIAAQDAGLVYLTRPASFSVETYPRAIPIGYWRLSNDSDTADLPTPVADTCALSDDDREHLVAYLMRVDLPSTEYRGFSRCRICGCRNGSADVCDGTYVWPSGLAHYVAEHRVALPDEFVRHCLASRGAAQVGTRRRGWVATTRHSRVPEPGGSEDAVAPTREACLSDAVERVGSAMAAAMKVDAVPVEAEIVAGRIASIREVSELEIAAEVRCGLRGEDE